MKRFFVVLLVLALLIPFTAFALTESDVVGCWAHYLTAADGSPTMAMLYLAEDHTCYYVIQSFRHDEAGLGRTHVGTWNLQSDGTVYAQTGNNSSTELTFYSQSIAYTKKTMDIYINITPYTMN